MPPQNHYYVYLILHLSHALIPEKRKMKKMKCSLKYTSLIGFFQIIKIEIEFDFP